MDFNIGNTLSNLPSLKDATASVSSGIQKASDYATAGAAKLKAEAISMLQSKGMLGKFDNVSKDLKIATVDNRYLIVDPNTNQSIAVVGNTPSVGTPASMYADGNNDRTAELKVVLTASPSGYNGMDDVVVFDVMPSITEARSVTYKSFTPQHHPGEIMKYEASGARDWNISAKLISRTVDEATWNLNIINMIRGWTMPFYGEGTASNAGTDSYLGAPPPIITLKAYGERMIGPVKCVLTNYSWDFPNDIDYIQANSTGGAKVPFPVILTVTLSLKETWSPAEFSGFDLMAFKQGDMEAAYKAFTSKAPMMTPPPTTTANVAQPENEARTTAGKVAAEAAAAANYNQTESTILLNKMNAAAASATAAANTAAINRPPMWSGQDPIAEGMANIKGTKNGWQ